MANTDSAPALSVLQVTVAAWPPLVLLLAVELLNCASKQRRRETGSESTGTLGAKRTGQVLETEADGETLVPIQPVMVSRSSGEDS